MYTIYMDVHVFYGYIIMSHTLPYPLVSTIFSPFRPPPSPQQQQQQQNITIPSVKFRVLSDFSREIENQHRATLLIPHLASCHEGSHVFPMFCPASQEVPCFHTQQILTIWVVSKYRGILPPKWMVKIMENPIKIDDLGTTSFANIHIGENKDNSG